MARYTLKTKDTGPPLEATLNEAGKTIDLTAASTVTLRIKLQGTSGGMKSLTTEILTPRSNGKVRVKFSEANTAVAGTYDAEFKVTWSNGEVDSVPNDGYETIVIEPSIE